MSTRISHLAEVDPTATIGAGSAVWQFAQVREMAQLGDRCSVGRNAYIDAGVRIGDDCKIQNQALIYRPAVIGDGVFVGPAAILTNDRYPRAVNVDGSRKSPSDWQEVGVTCLDGSSIGAGAVCVAPLTVGRWAVVAAGAVAVADVADYAVVAGNPARQIGWVGPAGVTLARSSDTEGLWVCPRTGSTFREVGMRLTEVVP